jgi:hypothetical protein
VTPSILSAFTAAVYEFATDTMTEAMRAYASWRDEVLEHRTAIRLIESLARDTLLAKLDLRPDPERDITAILALRKDVTARRQARVSPALKALYARVQGTRTLTRRQFLHMRKNGVGIANRPDTRVA